MERHFVWQLGAVLDALNEVLGKYKLVSAQPAVLVLVRERPDDRGTLLVSLCMDSSTSTHA